MKKILFLAVAIATIVNLQAQSKAGLKAGLSSSFITEEAGGKSQSTDNLTGLTIGITGVHELQNNLSLLYEFLYTQKGGQMTENGLTTKMKFNYIEVPLMLGIRINQLQLKAGPYAAFAITGKAEGKQNGVSASIDLFDGSFGEFKRFDAGLNVGASFDITKQISLNVNYEQGLVNMYPDSFQGQDAGNGYNRSISVSLSYFFQ